MEALPKTTEAVPEKSEKKRSTLGCISIGLTISSFLLILLCIVIGIWTKSLEGGAFALYFLAPPAVLLSLVAFILGIIGLIKKNQNKLLAVISIAPFSLGLALIAALVIYFWK